MAKSKRQKVVRLVVLGDGETYDNIVGCRVVSIPEDEWLTAEQDGGTDSLVEDYYDEGREISELLK